MALFNMTRKVFLLAVAGQLALSVQLATVAQAEMLTTDTAIAKYSAHADRSFLLTELKKQEVRDQIVELGVDPAEAEARLAALSDAEVAAMVARMEDEPAGAGVVGILFTALLILLITDILCLTKVFRFTRCA